MKKPLIWKNEGSKFFNNPIRNGWHQYGLGRLGYNKAVGAAAQYSKDAAAEAAVKRVCTLSHKPGNAHKSPDEQRGNKWFLAQV